MILPADKGRATVLLDRDEYDKKLQDMLDDTKVYRRLKRDPTPALERRMNSTLFRGGSRGVLRVLEHPHQL